MGDQDVEGGGAAASCATHLLPQGAGSGRNPNVQRGVEVADVRPPAPGRWWSRRPAGTRQTTPPRSRAGRPLRTRPGNRRQRRQARGGRWPSSPSSPSSPSPSPVPRLDRTAFAWAATNSATFLVPQNASVRARARTHAAKCSPASTMGDARWGRSSVVGPPGHSSRRAGGASGGRDAAAAAAAARRQRWGAVASDGGGATRAPTEDGGPVGGGANAQQVAVAARGARCCGVGRRDRAVAVGRAPARGRGGATATAALHQGRVPHDEGFRTRGRPISMDHTDWIQPQQRARVVRRVGHRRGAR